MQLTPEQLEALIGMSDIGGMEDEQQRLLKQAESLRNRTGIKGNDWGANLGRAGYGVAGAFSDYKAAKAGAPITDARQSILAKLLKAARKPPPLPNVPLLPTPSQPFTPPTPERPEDEEY